MKMPNFNQVFTKILPLLALSSLAHGATPPFKQPTDTIQFGKPSSTLNKNLIFDFGLGASNPSCSVDNASKTLTYNKNAFSLGDGTAGDKTLTALTGAGTPPKIKWSNASSSWQFSNDGVTFQNFGSGSGSGGGSSVETIEQRAAAQHYGIITDPIDNSISTGFYSQPESYTINGVLLDTYTGGNTTIPLIWAPAVLSASDKNTDSITNWSAQSAGSNLGTSATRKVGSASISFDKAGTNTNARIRYDAGSVSLAFAGNTNLWFWINLPTAVGVSNIEVRMDVDGTNYETFTQSTQYDGVTAIASGWNLMKFNLAGSGIASGTGWDPSKSVEFVHVGVNTSVAATTLTGVLVDAIYFELSNPQNFANAGSEFTILDTSNVENLQIDSSNTSVDGGAVILTSPLANNYSPGIGTGLAQVYRSSLGLTLNQAAMTSIDQMNNAISGSALKTQSVRLSRTFRTPLAAATLDGFADVTTSQVYPVLSTTGSTIVVSDTVDQHADLLSGETVHVFRVVQNGGKKQFIHRNDCVQTANSTNSLGQTTIHCVPPVGTVAGDYVVKKHIQASYSVGAIGANESFVSFPTPASPDDVLMYDSGIPIPNQSTLFGLWTLGSPNAQKNQFGTAADLIMTGTLNQNAQFKAGQLGSTGWSAANYYTAPGSSPTISTPSMMSVSVWYYLGTPAGTGEPIIGNYVAAANGWYLAVVGSNAFDIVINNSVAMSAGTVNANAWNLLTFNYVNGGTSSIYLNGALVQSASVSSISANSQDMQIGHPGGLSIQPTDRVAQAGVWIGSNLSAQQILQIYNQGLATVVGFGPQLKYRYHDVSISGQNAVMKAYLDRDTSNIVPLIDKMGLIGH